MLSTFSVFHCIQHCINRFKHNCCCKCTFCPDLLSVMYSVPIRNCTSLYNLADWRLLCLCLPVMPSSSSCCNGLPPKWRRSLGFKSCSGGILQTVSPTHHGGSTEFQIDLHSSDICSQPDTVLTIIIFHVGWENQGTATYTTYFFLTTHVHAIQWQILLYNTM